MHLARLHLRSVSVSKKKLFFALFFSSLRGPEFANYFFPFPPALPSQHFFCCFVSSLVVTVVGLFASTCPNLRPFITTRALKMASESEEPKLHLLKDKWFVFYQPALKAGEAYDGAFEEVDYVSSIEEVFATINTIPNLTLLPQDDSLFFSRNKKIPRFENFPNGCRISLFTRTKSQADDVLLRLVAAVMGDAVTKQVTEGEPVCDIIRITHKPHKLYVEAARLEVWCRESNKTKGLEDYFKELVRFVPGVTIKLTMIENKAE